MGFMELARQRYSVRRFSGERPSQGLLDRLLECLLVAPTAKNMQSERIYVLQSDEALAKVDAITKCRYELTQMVPRPSSTARSMTWVATMLTSCSPEWNWGSQGF